MPPGGAGFVGLGCVSGVLLRGDGAARWFRIQAVTHFGQFCRFELVFSRSSSFSFLSISSRETVAPSVLAIVGEKRVARPQTGIEHLSASSSRNFRERLSRLRDGGSIRRCHCTSPRGRSLGTHSDQLCVRAATGRALQPSKALQAYAARKTLMVFRAQVNPRHRAKRETR